MTRAYREGAERGRSTPILEAGAAVATQWKRIAMDTGEQGLAERFRWLGPLRAGLGDLGDDETAARAGPVAILDGILPRGFDVGLTGRVAAAGMTNRIGAVSKSGGPRLVHAVALAVRLEWKEAREDGEDGRCRFWFKRFAGFLRQPPTFERNRSGEEALCLGCFHLRPFRNDAVFDVTP